MLAAAEHQAHSALGALHYWPRHYKNILGTAAFFVKPFRWLRQKVKERGERMRAD